MTSRSTPFSPGSTPISTRASSGCSRSCAFQSISTDPAYRGRLPRRGRASRGRSRRASASPPRCARPAGIRWCRRKRPTGQRGRTCCSTAITTCSRSIRSTCGRRRRSSRALATLPTAARSIVARGACDDKGQVMTFVEACRAWKAVDRRAAARRHHAVRRRGGMRLEEPAGLRRGAHGRAQGRRRAGLRHRHVGRRHAGDHHLAARPGLRGGDDQGAPTATCIPACSAARRRIRSGCWRASSAACTTTTAASPSRASTTACASLPPRCAAMGRRSASRRRSFSARSGCQGAGGREGPHADRADLVAADLRRQRHRRRLYGRGLQDRDPGARPRPRSRSAWSATRTRTRSATASATFVRARLPADCTAEFIEHTGAPAIALDWGMPAARCGARARSTEEWGREAAADRLGRIDPDRRRLQAHARHRHAADRLRPRRRPHPLAEREIRPELLPQGHAQLGAHPGGAGGLTAAAAIGFIRRRHGSRRHLVADLDLLRRRLARGQRADHGRRAPMRSGSARRCSTARAPSKA